MGGNGEGSVETKNNNEDNKNVIPTPKNQRSLPNKMGQYDSIIQEVEREGPLGFIMQGGNGDQLN